MSEEELLNKIRESVETCKNDKNAEIFFHYTDVEKLLAILDKKETKISKAKKYIKNCNPKELYSLFLNENYISNYGACDLLEILEG